MSKISAIVTLSATAFAFVATVASAAGTMALPARRTGYWEITVTIDKTKAISPLVMHACLDTASDKAMMAAAMSVKMGMCKQSDIEHLGDSYVWDSTCNEGAMKIASHVIVSGDFQSSYSMVTTGEISVGGKEPEKMASLQIGKWLSDACANGMVSGDLDMGAAGRININNIVKGMAGKAAPSE